MSNPRPRRGRPLAVLGLAVMAAVGVMFVATRLLGLAFDPQKTGAALTVAVIGLGLVVVDLLWD